MKALIPAPADCEVRYMTKFLNVQSIAPIEIHRELCQVYGHTRLDGQRITCRWEIIHPISRTSRPVISIFSYNSRNSCPVASVFSEWQRSEDKSHSGSNLRRHTSTTQDTKVGPTVWQMSQFRRWMCWKIVQHLLYLFQYIFPLYWVLFLQTAPGRATYIGFCQGEEWKKV